MLRPLAKEFFGNGIGLEERADVQEIQRVWMASGRRSEGQREGGGNGCRVIARPLASVLEQDSAPGVEKLHIRWEPTLCGNLLRTTTALSL